MRHRDAVDPLVARLRPQVSASEELDPARPAARELRAAITEKNEEPAVAPKRTVRRLLIAVPVAAVLAAGGVAATALMPASAPGPVAPQEAAALEIDVADGVVVAEVKDPTADPQRYAEEFAEHGLKVDLSLVPASPSMVGKLVYLDSDMKSQNRDDRDVEVIESPEQCTPDGGCPVGVRIPEGYRNHVQLVFGRAPGDGEKYEATGAEDTKGQDLVGMTVAEAELVLRNRGLAVAEYRVEKPAPAGGAPAPSPSAAGASDGPPPQQPEDAGQQSVVEKAQEVPDDYVVRDVQPWGPGEVLLFTGESGD
ncbi:hypothetical protein FZ103_18010 [Streptomonospora sp. PA3]|uniref:hypothetical protein n=1 Tax=Streptomonospora sp. PA3 TaxID=2607326 RepID=UPI0012DBE9DB|nr:hypothetical protein [Streptomonospora sp. PA3]MUL43041.1 hypothetical protein [Streptomonospora sp. PA3]